MSRFSEADATPSRVALRGAFHAPYRQLWKYLSAGLHACVRNVPFHRRKNTDPKGFQCVLIWVTTMRGIFLADGELECSTNR